MNPFPVIRGALAKKMITIILLQQMGIIPKKAPSGNASTTRGTSLGPVPESKGVGVAGNVPPKHTSVRTQFVKK